MTEPDFRKTYFSGRKSRKYAGKPGFWAFSQDFIISFFWFFAQRCTLAMLITWLSPIFDKNFFPAENTGNMPEITVFADFVRTFPFYFVNLAHWCKMAMSKMWPSPIFEKHIFPAENAGNMPEKLVFWRPFLEISSLVFSNFLHKDAY